MKTYIMILFLMTQCGCFAQTIDLSGSCNANINFYINDNDKPEINPATEVGVLP